MLFSSIHLPVPTGPRYEPKKIRANDIYLYYRISSYRNNKGELKHNRKIIGKILHDDNVGMDYFVPNPTYYELHELPLPQEQPLKKAGPVSKGKKAVGAKATASDSIYSFGYSLAVLKIAKDLGLSATLKENFSDDEVNTLLAVGSYFGAGTPYGSGNFDYYIQKNPCFNSKLITSQRLSELYEELNEERTRFFFRDWIRYHTKDDVVCYDVTSISSYSKALPFIAWGYNRDKEKLPQVNLGMFCTVKSKLPLFYTYYNGNINDFTNLPYVVEQAKAVNLDDRFMLVFDGGFAEEKTIDNLLGRKFIMGAPMSFCINIREHVLKWRQETTDTEHTKMFVYDDEVLQYCEIPLKISRFKTRLIMFKSRITAYNHHKTLDEMVVFAEQQLQTLTKINKSDLYKYEDFYDITLNEDGSFSYKLSTKRYQEAQELCGCFALFCTDDSLTPMEVIKLYRDKDCVEKAFGSLKNDILDERLRIKQKVSTHGKLFLSFLGLIIRTEFKKRLLPWLKTNKKSLKDAIAILLDMQFYYRDRQWLLTKSLTKQQKEIAKILELPLNFLQ